MNAITERLARLSELTRYVLLVTLAIGSWWLADKLGPTTEKGKKLEPGKVDYYSKGLQRQVMDETGKPKEFLTAEELVHYERENRSELKKPVMTLYAKDGPPWVINAETATIPGEENLIVLNGDVLVLRAANKDGRTMRIETSNVRVKPDINYAETDEDIRVISPPDYMTGTGAKLKFGDGIEYTVFANVRRKHDVQN